MTKIMSKTHAHLQVTVCLAIMAYGMIRGALPNIGVNSVFLHFQFCIGFTFTVLGYGIWYDMKSTT